MSAPITLDLARKAVAKLYADASVELVLPDDPKRVPVVYAVALAHELAGTGMVLSTIRQSVTITLPGAGDAAKLVSLVPSLGGVMGPIVSGFLTSLAASLVHPATYLSPAAYADPLELLATAAHELSHVGQLRAGGPMWCLDYLAVPEARGAAEAEAYAATMVVRCQIGGVDIAQAEGDANAALAGYGLPASELALAKAIILSTSETLAAGGVVGSLVTTVRNALVAVGWSPL